MSQKKRHFTALAWLCIYGESYLFSLCAALRFVCLDRAQAGSILDWTVVASDPRYMINKTLTENGIVIAFPQREIHLDTSRPLEVRVLADATNIENAND